MRDQTILTSLYSLQTLRLAIIVAVPMSLYFRYNHAGRYRERRYWGRLRLVLVLLTKTFMNPFSINVKFALSIFCHYIFYDHTITAAVAEPSLKSGWKGEHLRPLTIL